MFSVAEKRKIAEAIEKVLLELNHPEMPKEKPVFKIHIDGKESWSWADIEPNWVFDDGHKVGGVNYFNEIARDVLGKNSIEEAKP
jgi:hypothetical protein